MIKDKCKHLLFKGTIYIILFLIFTLLFIYFKEYLEANENAVLWLITIIFTFMILFPTGIAYIYKYLTCLIGDVL